MLTVENFTYKMKEFDITKAMAGDVVVAVFNGEVVFKREQKNLVLPVVPDFGPGLVEHCLLMGLNRGQKVLACVVSEVPPLMVARDLRRSFHRIEPGQMACAGMALNLLHWHLHSRFCGRCGSETRVVGIDLHKRCPECRAVFYPRLSPAVIVRVRKGDQLLLARSQNLPPGMFSVLAGFVNIGESIEQTVEREVKEETGLTVENIQYFCSQPWPFPDSLMLAMTADYKAGEITLEDEEIEEAGWYSIDNLPLYPSRVSVAGLLIDDFIETVKKERG